MCTFGLVLVRFGFHVIFTVALGSAKTFDVLWSAGFRWKVIAVLAVGAASDLLIATCICWALVRMRSGFTSSDKLVDKLVAFTIGTSRLCLNLLPAR